MKKLLAAITVLVLLSGVVGYDLGKRQAYQDLAASIIQSQEAAAQSAYYVAVTNARACVLALDSYTMRLLDNFGSLGLFYWVGRANSCDTLWDRALGLAPGDKEDAYLSDARFFYDHWVELTKEAITTRGLINLAEQKIANGDGGIEVLRDLMQGLAKLDEQKAQLKKFRDRIEREFLRGLQ